MGFLFLTFSIYSFGQDLTGQWNGILKVQGTQLRLVFNITKTESGLSSTMDSPDKGSKGIPVTKITFENSKYNSLINPKYNTTINPKYNTTINPKYNTTINPKYNTTINPKYNTTINPKYNSRINPKLNPSFDGFYIYVLDANATLYAIKASDKVLIFYNFNNEAMFYAVAINKGYAVYDIISNEQTSYIISNNSKGYNQFNLNGEWTGFIV